MEVNPVGEKERIRVLDVMRGSALLGILLVNMKSFSGPDSYIMFLSYEYWNESYNVAANVFLDFFVQGNFITMFSFLFGFGMIIMKERVSLKKSKFLPFFIKRQFVLLLFGAIHVIFFWHGDILINYAVIGLAALLFIRLSPKTLFVTGLVILTLYAALMTSATALYHATGEPLKVQQKEDEKNATIIQEQIIVYSAGSFAEVMKERLSEWKDLNAFIFMSVISLIPMFLFGMHAAKKREGYTRSKLWQIWWIALFLGAGSKALPVLFYSEKGESGAYDISWIWGYSFGGAWMSIFYLACIALLYQTDKGKRWLGVFEAPGRMAFTIYLMQSVICTAIFYSYGLGLYGSTGPLFGAFLAMLIYSAQLLFARWWLLRFTMGPLEWIWRTLTYGKKIKLKREMTITP
ncbi:DUF418 domain-containing protein [Fictibacillus iocasae]|uniref:DUF418 domain-containing protein n=1 Tax=Fictibacillus iocasae TaxID=2715437 RepID=A0ABW2NLE8_9BACL